MCWVSARRYPSIYPPLLGLSHNGVIMNPIVQLEVYALPALFPFALQTNVSLIARHPAKDLRIVKRTWSLDVSQFP